MRAYLLALLIATTSSFVMGADKEKDKPDNDTIKKYIEECLVPISTTNGFKKTTPIYLTGAWGSSDELKKELLVDELHPELLEGFIVGNFSLAAQRISDKIDRLDDHTTSTDTEKSKCGICNGTGRWAKGLKCKNCSGTGNVTNEKTTKNPEIIKKIKVLTDARKALGKVLIDYTQECLKGKRPEAPAMSNKLLEIIKPMDAAEAEGIRNFALSIDNKRKQNDADEEQNKDSAETNKALKEAALLRAKANLIAAQKELSAAKNEEDKLRAQANVLSCQTTVNTLEKQLSKTN